MLYISVYLVVHYTSLYPFHLWIKYSVSDQHPQREDDHNNSNIFLNRVSQPNLPIQTSPISPFQSGALSLTWPYRVGDTAIAIWNSQPDKQWEFLFVCFCCFFVLWGCGGVVVLVSSRSCGLLIWFGLGFFGGFFFFSCSSHLLQHQLTRRQGISWQNFTHKSYIPLFQDG